jgi:molybdopterin-guanine dinucleotide biosynthesis protein A
LATCPGDSPFSPRDVFKQLHRTAIENQSVVAIAASNGRQHPVFGVWSTKLLSTLRDTLVETDIRAIGYWAKLQQAQVVEFPIVSSVHCQYDPFFNINTPEELAYANTLYRQE